MLENQCTRDPLWAAEYAQVTLVVPTLPYFTEKTHTHLDKPRANDQNCAKEEQRKN
jgi:hypothetical protein